MTVKVKFKDNHAEQFRDVVVVEVFRAIVILRFDGQPAHEIIADDMANMEIKE